MPVGQLAELAQILQPTVEIGILDHQAGRVVGNFRFPVAHHFDADTVGLAIGANNLEIDGRNGIRYGHAVTAGNSAGHEDALGQAGGAVIHAGVGDLHAEEAADQGLELVDYLERALADFGLVGSVGGEKLAAGHQGLNDGGYEMVVGPSTQEGGAAAQRTVSSGQCSQFLLYFQLRKGGGQVQWRVSEFLGYVVKEFVYGRQAQGGQHFGLFIFSVGDVMGLKVGGGQGNFS